MLDAFTFQLSTFNFQLLTSVVGVFLLSLF